MSKKFLRFIGKYSGGIWYSSAPIRAWGGEMEPGFSKRALSLSAGLVSLVGLFLLLPPKADAIPAFSRQYQTSCATCHVDFPKLNDFGKAFKDAGFKFPKDDETFIKIPPVMLGAPAQKELWPHAIWPGTIPGISPIGLRMNNFFQVVSRNRNNLASAPITVIGTNSGVGPFIPRTDFQAGLFSIFTAGNFGSDIAFWLDDDFSIGGENANGGLGDGYLKFVNLGHLVKLPKDSFSLRVGQFELDLPFSPARSYNLSGWDIFGQGNVGTSSQFVNNNFTMDAAAQGAEFSGGHNYGGYHYSLAVVSQNTSTANITTAPNVSPANGVAFTADSNFKDLYGRFSYRWNLERDPKSRREVQAAGPMGPRDHTSIRLGTFYFYGRSLQRVLDPATNAVILGTVREPFYRAGGDFDFHYRTFNLYGAYMYGHDHNVVPAFDITGTTLTGVSRGTPATFDGGFIQADYLALPWLMAIMRWDAVNSTADRNNALPAGGPFRSTRNRYTPGVQFLIHANIKAAFEYQVQPEFLFTDPNTGLPRPFRTNVAVAGLEFVY